MKKQFLSIEQLCKFRDNLPEGTKIKIEFGQMGLYVLKWKTPQHQFISGMFVPV